MANELKIALQDLEIKLSYQEQTIETLNQTVSLQQQDILDLKNQLNVLSKHLKEFRLDQQGSGIKSSMDEMPPPHY